RQVLPGRAEVAAIDVEPVGGPSRQHVAPRHRVQVAGRAQIGSDAGEPKHVEQVLADPGIDVARGHVLARRQAVVPAAAPFTAAHVDTLPSAWVTGQGYPLAR